MALQDQLRAFREQKLQAEKEAGRQFMEENRKREEVKELPNGIQYEVLKEGNGRQPAPTDKIKAHYRGAFLDGKEFDSSFKRNQPFTAPLRSLIKGWQDVVPMMKEGSTWRLWIPSDLAYGDYGASDIPGGATLLFDIELIEIV